MAEKGPDYSNENIAKILCFVLEKICEDRPDNNQLDDFLSLLDNNKFVEALFLIRENIWAKCENPEVKGTKDDPAVWERMKTTISSQTYNDGFIYSETPTNTILKYDESKSAENATYLGKPNLIDDLISVCSPSKGFFVDRKKNTRYRYCNEIDHLISRLLLVLMSKSCPEGPNFDPARSNSRPGKFQENLYSLAGCKPAI